MTDDQNVKITVFAVGKQNDRRKGVFAVYFDLGAEGFGLLSDEVHAAFNFPHVAGFGAKFDQLGSHFL